MDVKRLRQILDLDPEDPLANFALGHKLVMESADPADHAAAIPHLRKAMAGDRHHLAAYYALALALQSQGEEGEARRVCEAALAVLPAVPPGGGQDLEPAFQELLEDLE